ncbi:MAG: ABC transporter permease [Candidatus Nanopelagicales bacterium]
MGSAVLDARASRAGLWSNRYLIWNFARRDLKGRFKGTAVGWAWSLLLPLATVLIYSIVFSLFIRISPPNLGNGDPGRYWVWLLVGMVAWNFLLNATTQGIPSLLGNGPLLQKIYIPSFVPVVANTVAIGVQSLIELGILAVILAVFGNVGLSWLLVPFWVVLLLVFAASFTYALSVANVFYRDVGQLVAVAMQMIFFLTPIIYPLTMIPEQWNGIPVRSIVSASPFAEFVTAGRTLLYDLQVPDLRQMMALVAWTAAMLLVASLIARRGGQDVGEFI